MIIHIAEYFVKSLFICPSLIHHDNLADYKKTPPCASIDGKKTLSSEGYQSPHITSHRHFANFPYNHELKRNVFSY